MAEQLSLLAPPLAEGDAEANPLAKEVWLYAQTLKFDAPRFKRFVVAGFQLERYDRDELQRASDERLMALMRRLHLLESGTGWHFPQADERQFWNIASSLKVPHQTSRAIIQWWSFDGFTDWVGAVEEMILEYGWIKAEESQAA
jgi:hypothetical protein